MRYPALRLRTCPLVILGLVTSGLAPLAAPARAQSVITNSRSVRAIVETVDPVAKQVLMRRTDGTLVTISYGRAINDLPHLHAGDRLTIGYVATVNAHLAKPGSPLPESTVSESRGYWNGHPHGVVASFRRERVRIISVDNVNKTVSFVGQDDVTRVVAVRDQAMRDFITDLKEGDDVDVTHTDAINYSIVDPAS